MISTIEVTLDHALFYAQHLNKCDSKCVATAVLMELGIPTNRIGFEYLKRAVVSYSKDPLQMYTKDIYPSVGTIYDTEESARQVEQAMRTAILEAWKHRDEEAWLCYFPVDEKGNIPRPSNGYFISRVGRFLQLWEGCCEEVCYGKH